MDDSTDGEISPPPSPETREREIRIFLVLTIHRIFKKSGLLKSLRDNSAAMHIHRLVEPTLKKLSMPHERIPQVNLHRPVANGVAKELKETFRSKTRHTLLLQEATVEDVISDCIQRHTSVEISRKRNNWGSSCKSITVLFISLLVSSAAIAWLCLLFGT